MIKVDTEVTSGTRIYRQVQTGFQMQKNCAGLKSPNILD